MKKFDKGDYMEIRNITTFLKVAANPEFFKGGRAVRILSIRCNHTDSAIGTRAADAAV